MEMQVIESENVLNDAFVFLNHGNANDIIHLTKNQKKIPFPSCDNPDFRFIDLFSGIGGFRIPFQELHGQCNFSSEINLYAQESYYLNFGEYPRGDITKINPDSIPSHDVLTAGFPCQPFSISGKMRGFDDARGNLIYDVFKIVKYKQPKVVLLENVKHLMYHNHGKTLNIILTHLEKLGYFVEWELLNASNFGVPQNRERVIIIGSKKKAFDFSQLKIEKSKSLKYFLDKDSLFEYLTEPYTLIDSKKTQQSGLIFAGYRNKKIRVAGVRPGTEHLSRVHKQPNRIYSSDGIHPALPSQETSGRFWILNNGKVRKLTIDECFRIMGFPDNYIKVKNTSELYKQIGNSVCIPMVKSIGEQIKKQLL